MNNQKTAIVLGGTIPHCELIKLLKYRGYYTILADYTLNPPALEFADEKVDVSTLDKDAVLELAKNRNADLVISTCIDQANVTCCYVAEQLGLPHPYSYDTALNVTDKTKMKKIMWDSNIPTSKYVRVSNKDEIHNLDLQYPVMVKPADSNSANGVKKASSVDELSSYIEDSLSFSRNGQAIIEEFIEGVEISAYCVIADNKAKLVMAQERISTFDGESNAIKCYAAYAPARISKQAFKNAEKIAENIAKAFNLNNTPLFFQGIVTGNEISVIEFAPRVGGGISYNTIKNATNFDIISATIDSFLGVKIDINNISDMSEIYVVNQIYGKDGVFSKVLNIEEAEKMDCVDSISFYKKSGAIIDNSRASSSRIGVILLHGSTEQNVYDNMNKIINTIDVLNEKEESMIRRELCIGKNL